MQAGPDELSANPLALTPFPFPTAASITPFELPCGSDDVFCPAGVMAPIAVPLGSYTVDYLLSPCPPGTWRSWANYTAAHPADPSVIATHALKPVCLPCPLATFKHVEGDALSLCHACDPKTTLDLTLGQAEGVGEGQADRLTCPCKPLARDIEGELYFNYSTGGCDVHRTPPVRLSSPFAANISLTRSSVTQCEAGYYCIAGQRFLCPAGRYGDQKQETRPACAGSCPNGYYCPEGTIVPVLCGAAHLICPEPFAAPEYVPMGAYSNEEVAEDRRFASALCPLGFYCPGDGRRYPCPEGSYTDRLGTNSSLCMGPCMPG